VTYDPYGEPITADHIAAHPDLRIGHQGLFLDRLDLLGDGTLDMASPPSGTQYTLATPAFGLGNKALYQNRNRTYSPSLGRFLQRDPNGSGAVIIAAANPNATHPVSRAVRYNARSAYADGMNLLAYASSNPAMMKDCLGLESMMELNVAVGEGGAADGAQNAAVAGGVRGIFQTLLNIGIRHAGRATAIGGGYLLFRYAWEQLRWMNENLSEPEEAAVEREVPLKQLSRLSDRQVDRLMEEGGQEMDPHGLKDNDSTKDLYVNRKGDIYVGNKDGTGVGNYTNFRLPWMD
jgi:hypothetical protein